MASSSRTEAVARLGELVLIDGSQYLVDGLMPTSDVSNSEKNAFRISFGGRQKICDSRTCNH